MGSRVFHISEADLVKDVRSILRKVRTGAEIVVERGAQPFAVIRAAEPIRRKISECIAMLPADSTAAVAAEITRVVSKN